MVELQPLSRARFQSIDILRGLVMVIMALDHTRDFFFKVVMEDASTVAIDPTNMATTTPLLFFTRWITHFCAPVFIFLAGLSIYLMGMKKSKQQLSIFLLKRGVFLILVELVIVTLGWTFDPLYKLFILQVIWAIGVSMVLMALVVRFPFPFPAILALGLLIVLLHNLLDYPKINQGLKGGFIPDLLYFSQFSDYRIIADHHLVIVYAFLPWTGLMMLGYCLGRMYEKRVTAEERRKSLITLGLIITAVFLALRFFNEYGDPLPWSAQPRGSLYSFLSFLNLNKYPPSLLFLCMTIGPSLVLLALFEKAKGKFSSVLQVYGRVPLFYYVVHFYILHSIVVIVFFVAGYPLNEIRTDSIFLFRPSSFGFGLGGVYLIWILVILALYPLCRWYDRYKSKHLHEKPWLSYF